MILRYKDTLLSGKNSTRKTYGNLLKIWTTVQILLVNKKNDNKENIQYLGVLVLRNNDFIIWDRDIFYRIFISQRNINSRLVNIINLYFQRRILKNDSRYILVTNFYFTYQISYLLHRLVLYLFKNLLISN